MADDGFPLPGTTSITTIGEWENYFRALNMSGVIRGIGNELGGSLNSGARTAVLATGAAMLRGFHKPVTAPTGTAIPAASAQNRVDRLVVRLDRAAGTAANFIKPVVIQGTSGSSTPPAMQSSDSGQWDLQICRWTSQADGGLSGLVDERYWSDQSFWSWARPPATPHRFGVELDGGIKLMWAHGDAWSPIGAVDTDDLAVAVATARWTSAGDNLGRKVGGVADVDINVRFNNGSGGTVVSVTEESIDASGLHVATVPAALRPSRTKYAAIVGPGDLVGRLQVQPDGGVYLWQVNGPISSGFVLRATITYIA